MTDVYARTLRRAAQVAGGVNELAERLCVPSEELARWLATGGKLVPLEVFLQAVDVIVSHDLDQVSNEPTVEFAPQPAAPADPQDEPTVEIAPRKK
jgi:hypothetical protein